MDDKNAKQAVSGSAASETTPSSAIAAPEPLRLKRGTRIRLGHRTGTLEAVRGDWKEPYEVRIRWDGEKYPQYIVFRTLERDHEQGKLKVL